MATKKKNKTLIGVIVGIVVLALVLVVGGVFWITSTLFGGRGAATPEAAVDEMVSALEKRDGIALLKLTSPADLESVQNSLAFVGVGSPGIDLDPQLMNKYNDVLNTLEITVERPDENKPVVTPYFSDVSAVSVTGTTVTVNGDKEAFNTAVEELARYLVEKNDRVEDGKTSAFIRDLRESLDNTVEFPQTTNLGEQFKHGLITVEEGGKWFVSPTLTAVATALPEEMFPVASPESLLLPNRTEISDAKEAMVDAFEGAAEMTRSGNADQLLNALPLAEARMIKFATMKQKASLGQLTGVWTIKGTPEFTEKNIDSGKVFLPKNVRVEITSAYGSASEVILDGLCMQSQGGYSRNTRSCLDQDVDSFSGKDLSELGFVVLKFGDGWRFSPVATVFSAVRIASE